MIVTETHIPELQLLSRGKVRDIYAVDEKSLLIVTTDRMSAFDVLMNEPIPGKGVILNQITLFWMKRFAHLLPNHILESDVDRYPDVLKPYKKELEGRSVIAKRAKNLPVECIVRGFLSGSGWKSYKETGMLCGYTLPAGLRESDRLENPLFTPSTKADAGQHDENISFEQSCAILGEDVARRMRDTTLQIYGEAREYAASRGILIADTKLEFGLVDGKLTLIDEVLTPDSSRFWSAAQYTPGQGQPSFDKQFLRDWLETQPWNKKAPAPALPKNVIETTAAKYQEAYDILTK